MIDPSERRAVSTRTRAASALLAAVLTCFGCGDMKQAFTDCKATESAIRSELGVDSACSFRVVNGHTSVTARLKSTPPGDATAVKSKVTDIVNRTFHAKVERVDVAL